MGRENAYPNSGVLFRNSRQREGSRDPDYNGSGEIDGCEYWISAWVKEGAKGKFLSLSFKPKDKDQQSAAAPAKAASPKPQKPARADDDDAPF